MASRATSTARSATCTAASRREVDPRGEAPGPVEHHPDGEADVLVVVAALGDPVAQGQRLGADLLEPEVGGQVRVTTPELGSPGQGDLGQPAGGQCGEGRIYVVRQGASSTEGTDGTGVTQRSGAQPARQLRHAGSALPALVLRGLTGRGPGAVAAAVHLAIGVGTQLEDEPLHLEDVR